MFLAHRNAGWPGQAALWELVQRSSLLLIDVPSEGRARTAALMEKYRDVPMALADATLVAMAERLEVSSIFTLDGHFEVYRRRDRRPFDVIP